MVLTLSLQMVLVTSLVSVYSDETPPTVTTCQGRIEGYIINTTYGCMNAFQGIPYAKPPVCDLRFKAPVPADPWNGTFRAVSECSVCAQTNFFTGQFSGDENCLCINVYTPKLPNCKKPLPVMVWIHGGAFYIASGNIVGFSPILIVKRKVIYVSFNYRLSAFGYLSTMDEACPGNMGMKDQVLALRWVQKNIAAFGGDPKKVTIFGVSAGGASVAYHIVSPMSAGLFRAAIPHSGSFINGWARIPQQDPRSSAFFLGNMLGFRGNTSQQLLEFMRSVNAKDIADAAVFNLPEYFRYRVISIYFCPVTEPLVNGEESFLPESAACRLEQGKINKVFLMAGSVTSDGATFLADKGVFDGRIPPEVIDKNFSLIFKPELRCNRHNPCGDEMIAKIKSFYFGNEPVKSDTLLNLIDMTTDLFIAEGTYYLAEKVSALGPKPVYFYEFSYVGAFTNKQNYAGLPPGTGPIHLDELSYLFDTGKSAAPGSTEEFLRQRLPEMWTNFAKTGNPTPDCPVNGTTWLPYSSCATNYLNIDAQFSLQTDFRKDRMDFWKNLYGCSCTQCNAD